MQRCLCWEYPLTLNTISLTQVIYLKNSSNGIQIHNIKLTFFSGLKQQFSRFVTVDKVGLANVLHCNVGRQLSLIPSDNVFQRSVYFLHYSPLVRSEFNVVNYYDTSGSTIKHHCQRKSFACFDRRTICVFPILY